MGALEQIKCTSETTLKILITIFIRVPMVAMVYVLIVNEINVTSRIGSIVAFVLLFIVIIGTFLTYHPIYKRKKKDTFKKYSSEELRKIKKVQLFNISNIGQEYEVCEMIESRDTNKEQAKLKLQIKAFEIGANGIINVTTNIDNNIIGSVGSVVGMPRMVSGTTSTVTTYYYEGTAIKLKYV